MLGDIADDDARRRPEIDRTVATANPAEIFDELFADISVSERRKWRRRQLHTLLWKSTKQGNTWKERCLVWSSCVTLKRYGIYGVRWSGVMVGGKPAVILSLTT
jgi:hypothetical protein